MAIPPSVRVNRWIEAKWVSGRNRVRGNCPKTRAYAERRTTEGKTKKEIIRCLKR